MALIYLQAHTDDGKRARRQLQRQQGRLVVATEFGQVAKDRRGGQRRVQTTALRQWWWWWRLDGRRPRFLGFDQQDVAPAVQFGPFHRSDR